MCTGKRDWYPIHFITMKLHLFTSWAKSSLFFIYFRLFKQTFKFLQQINCEKYPFSIQCWGSNPWPSEHESPLLTTRPGLPRVIINGFATKCQKVLPPTESNELAFTRLSKRQRYIETKIGVQIYREHLTSYKVGR